MKKNLSEILKKIDKEHYSLLVDIGKISKEEGLKSYLVGGMVRDLLLGFDTLDIDIVVENNAKLLAKALVKRFSNCELSAKHDRFHTAKIIFNINGKKIPIDLASTREEVYEYPAALPTVSVSDLKRDLYRRDFTINALAISLLPDAFGEIVDLFDGLIDLKEKKIRVLHELSFIDDPTRMIRAVRFACKLGFTIEENTKRLLKEAINSKQFDNLIEKIRGDRVKIELRYLFNLLNTEEAVNAFFDSGIYKMVATDLKPELSLRGRTKPDEAISLCVTSEDCFARLASLAKRVANAPRNDMKQWLIYLALIIKNLNFEQQENILKNLQLTSDEIKIIKDGFSVLNKLKERLKESFDSIIVYRELRNLSIESVLIVKSLLITHHSSLITLINEYLEKTSKIKLEINGQDLISMGVKEGKMIGEILEKILEIKIKNPAMSKKDEAKEAKTIIERLIV